MSLTGVRRRTNPRQYLEVVKLELIDFFDSDADLAGRRGLDRLYPEKESHIYDANKAGCDIHGSRGCIMAWDGEVGDAATRGRR